MPDDRPSPAPPLQLRLLGWVTVLVLGAIAALLLAVVLALVPARDAEVPQGPALAPGDVERALRLARAHDPRRALPGVVRTLRLSEHEAALMLQLAASRLHAGRWALEIRAERLQLRASLPLPPNPLGGWVNLELEAHATRDLPRLHAVRVGRLPLPGPLAEWALRQWAERRGLGDGGDGSVVVLQQVRLQPRRLEVVYAWGPGAPARVVRALVPPEDHERLTACATRLAELLAAAPQRPVHSLADVLPPLFELARRRSQGREDAAAENRAVLLVLGLVANGVGLSTLLPERAALPVRGAVLTLAGRRDFPQHLLVSAALAADSGSALADLIGLNKELSDARAGSGFSFNDIAANRAGTRLGELAITDPERLQRRLQQPLAETDFMPDVSDLPEFLGEREFRARYGAPGEPAYEALRAEIERRLDATPLFR